MSSPPHALPNGTVICSATTRYVVEGVLGTGGFGITYITRASAIGTADAAGTHVALKEFFLAADCQRDSASADSTIVAIGAAKGRVSAAMDDFIAEAERLKSIRGLSPNIVCVHEIFRANATAYFAMDYLAGPSLRDYIGSHHHLSEAETLELMRPLCDAVGKLHSRRIMHLDIKPGNIIVTTGRDNRPLPVLIDFGQSKHIADNGTSTRTVAAAGLTEGYAPIEQYAGISSFSPQTDVYALAATMLHALSGTRPPKPTELTPGYISRALPAYVTPQLRSTLTTALQFQASARQSDAIEFAAALPQASITGHSPKHSGRGILWILIALLLLCAIALSASLLLRRPTRQIVAPILEDDVPEQATVTDKSPVVVTESPEETPPAIALPTMHTYDFNGYFADQTGQRWPVKISATTDNMGRWGKCTYTNISYGIVLDLQGSGHDDRFIFHSDDKGANLTITVSSDGEGVWSGEAISGSKKLEVVLYE